MIWNWKKDIEEDRAFLDEPGTQSYKQKSGVNYAGFSYAENLIGYFPLKIFSVAKSSVTYAGFSFIGSGPG